MAKEDRKEQVLEFLVRTETVLPPGVLFHNLRYHGARFSRRSLDNYLTELVEEGYVRKVKREPLERRKLVDVEGDERGSFVATDSARERVDDVD